MRQQKNRGSRDDPEGERLGFERCFRDHYAEILAFILRRVAGRQAAEDAASETFAVVWRRRDRIPDPALPWLYGIAVRVIANQRRSARRRGNLLERLAHEAAAEPPVPQPSEAVHLRTELATAFRSLAPADQQALTLIAWEGLSPREAAAVLGCSYAAFRVRFHRARRRLRKQLESSGHLSIEGPSMAPAPQRR